MAHRVAARWSAQLRQVQACALRPPAARAGIQGPAQALASSPTPTGSCTADANATHRFGETQRRHYHSHKGGIGHIKAAAPDWTDPDWFSPAERLYTKLGRKEHGRLGPDLFQRSNAGMGDDFIEFEYDEDVATKFTEWAMVDTVNFDETMYAKEEYVRKVRNASQPLQPATPPAQSRVLDVDPLCSSLGADFVFTDTSEGSNRANRRVFIRERNGTLRTANEEERDEVHYMYFGSKKEKKRLPTVFSDTQDLQNAMNNYTHAYLLDGLCRMRPADSQDYTVNHIKVYSHVNQTGCFQALQDTPHFQGLIRYLVATANINKVVEALLSAEEPRMEEAADLVRCLIDTNQKAKLSKALVKALKNQKRKQDSYTNAEAAAPEGTHAVYKLKDATVLYAFADVFGNDMQQLLNRARNGQPTAKAM